MFSLRVPVRRPWPKLPGLGQAEGAWGLQGSRFGVVAKFRGLRGCLVVWVLFLEFMEQRPPQLSTQNRPKSVTRPRGRSQTVPVTIPEVFGESGGGSPGQARPGRLFVVVVA